MEEKKSDPAEPQMCQVPGFVEALLVGSGGGRLWLFLVVGVGDPGGLVLGRGAHADGAVGAHRVVPVDPLGGGELDIVDALPGALVADELGLVQGVEGLGQSEAERSPPLEPTEATASHWARVCPQRMARYPAPRSQWWTRAGQVRARARGGPPADDPPGVDVRHEGHVHPAAESTHICDVRHPQLVRPESGEMPVHQVGRALPPSVRTGWCAVTWRGGCRADPCRA